MASLAVVRDAAALSTVRQLALWRAPLPFGSWCYASIGEGSQDAPEACAVVVLDLVVPQTKAG